MSEVYIYGSNRFTCDMCYKRPEYEVIGEKRTNDLPAFDLLLCRHCMEKLASAINKELLKDKERQE